MGLIRRNPALLTAVFRFFVLLRDFYFLLFFAETNLASIAGILDAFCFCLSPFPKALSSRFAKVTALAASCKPSSSELSSPSSTLLPRTGSSTPHTPRLAHARTSDAGVRKEGQNQASLLPTTRYHKKTSTPTESAQERQSSQTEETRWHGEKRTSQCIPRHSAAPAERNKQAKFHSELGSRCCCHIRKTYSTSSQDVSTNATSCPLLKAHTTACLSRQADGTTQRTTATRLAQTLASLERAFRNWLAQAYTLLWKSSVHVDLPRGALCGCLTHVSIGELRRSARCLRRNNGEVLIISKN